MTAEESSGFTQDVMESVKTKGLVSAVGADG